MGVLTKAVNKIGGFMGAATLRRAGKLAYRGDFATAGKMLRGWADRPALGGRSLARWGAMGAVGLGVGSMAMDNPGAAVGIGAAAYLGRGHLSAFGQKAGGMLRARSGMAGGGASRSIAGLLPGPMDSLVGGSKYYEGARRGSDFVLGSGRLAHQDPNLLRQAFAQRNKVSMLDAVRMGK